VSVAAAHRPDVRARGLTPLWAGAAVAFLLFSLVVGVLVAPVGLAIGGVLEPVAVSPAEIPLGVVTAFFGAPFFALVGPSTRGGAP
jgi:ABC-type Fe3+-siderophore transport system permease subunit